jgi:hypothetical protein
MLDQFCTPKGRIIDAPREIEMFNGPRFAVTLDCLTQSEKMLGFRAATVCAKTFIILFIRSGSIR